MKPSSLLIYLTLDRYARSQPMRREEVIRRIHEDYGLWLSPKTISENAAIYKSLSQGEEPVMEFHHLGKKGYLMGKSSSQFSFGELVWILDHFAAISPEARAVASQQLRPYASNFALTPAKRTGLCSKRPQGFLPQKPMRGTSTTVPITSQ